MATTSTSTSLPDKWRASVVAQLSLRLCLATLNTSLAHVFILVLRLLTPKYSSLPTSKPISTNKLSRLSLMLGTTSNSPLLSNSPTTSLVSTSATSVCPTVLCSAWKAVNSNTIQATWAWTSTTIAPKTTNGNSSQK